MEHAEQATQEPRGGRRVVIVGAGMVGSAFAYALLMNGAAGEIVLIDVNRRRAEGEAMDLNHGLPFVSRPALVWAGDYPDCAQAAIVVVAAGASQRVGESRIDLVRRNVAVFGQIVPQVVAHAGPDTILLIVTNPVDILTYASLRLSGWEARRVLGSGTVLDSARFRFLLSRHCGVDPRSVHASIVGEHGDTELPVWSLANIAGVRLSDYCPVCANACTPGERSDIVDQVKRAAYEIIERKGATYYGIGLSLLTIVQSILGNENRVLTVSTLMTGQYGVSEVCLSLPCVVNRQGVNKVIPLPLDEGETAAFRHSAQTLKDVIGALELPPR